MAVSVIAQRPSSEDRIRAATWFAERGFGVFPVWSTHPDGSCRCPSGPSCDNPGKHPITPKGFHDATTDAQRIRTFLSAGSEPNYGLVCPEGVFALDVDGEGVQRLAELEQRHGRLPPTLRTQTANGEHVFLRWPDGLPQPIGQLFGFVTRWGSGRNAGYVIGPRSVHASGAVYTPAGQAGIADLPEAWARAAVEPERRPAVLTVSEGYQLPERVPASASRYEAIREYTAHLYNRRLSREEMWPLVRDVLAPRFEVPLSEGEIRARFDRLVDERMAARLGPPRSGGADELSLIAPGTLQVARLTEFESTPIEWLWPAWLARGVVTILDGNPGVSKSTLMADLVARVTTGRDWPDAAPMPAASRVLWITTEDDPGRVLRPRVEVAGGRPDRVLFATSEIVFPEASVAFRALLEELAAEPDGLALVILDPLFSHIDAKVRSIADADMRRHVMNPLQDAARAANVSVVVVRHFNKDTSATTLNRGAGSLGGIVGAARAVWTATVDREDESGETKVVGVTKLNYAKAPMPFRYRVVSKVPTGWIGDTVPAIEWLGEAPVSIEEINSEDEFSGDAMAELEAILVDGPVAATRVANVMKSRGFGRDATRRAAARLGVEKAKLGIREGWVWSLPEGSGPSEPSNSPPDSSKSAPEGSGLAGAPTRESPPEPDSSDSSKDRKSRVEGPPPAGAGAPTREGTCPECRRSVELDRQGRLRSHRPASEMHDAAWGREACPGSGGSPVAIWSGPCSDYLAHRGPAHHNTPQGWTCDICWPEGVA